MIQYAWPLAFLPLGRGALDTLLSRGMTGKAPLAFRSFWPQIGTGRLAVDEPLANRVRSGRKQP
ncbi:hypothetical protein CQ13_15975 [Bradyrhizobium retamae]|uniref:Uncharacterized protein n=1 Tax=Bradyrhizobium retamae TaxID=1300035 RepID=A0A0R3NI21_9BRAD|nr:hypothetical protein CQ13_15975 [Bradyrhizobium retamae]